MIRRLCSTAGNYVNKEKDIAMLQRQVRQHLNDGQYKEARSAAEACSVQVLDHFGSNHPVHASCLNNLAFIHKTLGEYDDAIEVYERALEAYKESVGEEHANFATTLNNLGLVYRTQAQNATAVAKLGLIEQSRECFEHSLKIRRKVLDRDHPDIAMSSCNLGTLLFHSGQKEQAKELLQGTLDQLVEKVGEKHVLSATVMNNLALVLKGLEEWENAISLYLKVKNIREELLGATHVDTITVCYNLAEAYFASGQEDKAQELRHHVVHLTKKFRD